MCTSCAPLTAVSQAIILREDLTACQELSDEACGQNRDGSRTSAHIEHAHAGGEAGVTEEPRRRVSRAQLLV
jgi:hypothetical protein